MTLTTFLNLLVLFFFNSVTACFICIYFKFNFDNNISANPTFSRYSVREFSGVQRFFFFFREFNCDAFFFFHFPFHFKLCILLDSFGKHKSCLRKIKQAGK